ncbi:F-box domain-containing protein [Mycena venus]|uniref:F-box domain-containing protein n=1 Tax=Mycena venus TaxID=2733690 RepID=A0A8H6Y154_9AGAR|nr:F-box domain-containing protein [Mycena venus]
MLDALEVDCARLGASDDQILDLDLEHPVSAEKTLAPQQLNSCPKKYPILTLPNEIVSEIFIHVLPVYPRCPSLTGLLSPTSLTHICTKWREIALSTPALWRAIPLPDTDISVERLAHIFDLWLKRSGSCPLSIGLDGECDGMDASDLLASFIPYRWRWEYLKIVISSSHLAALEGGMPLLRHLNLELFSATNDAVISDVPLLRSVVLNDIATWKVTLPWAQVTSLALNRVHLHECVPILQQTPNLVYCELRLFFSDDDLGTDVLTLPCLESLALNDPGHQPLIPYLEAFVTPALHRLRVPERFLGYSPIGTLQSFISKSGSKLQDIRITGDRALPKTFYREAFRSVERLSFSRRYNDWMTCREDSAIESDSDSSGAEE